MRKKENLYRRALAIGIISKSGELESVIDCKEISSFAAGGADPRAVAMTYMSRSLNSWRKHYPDDNLRIVELDYSKSDPKVSFEGWRFA